MIMSSERGKQELLYALNEAFNEGVEFAYLKAKIKAESESREEVQKLREQIIALRDFIGDTNGTSKRGSISREVYDGSQTAPKQPLVSDRAAKHPWYARLFRRNPR